MSAAAAVRARAVAVPAWLWLAGIVVVSAAVRVALARRMVAPWVMIDELVYSELAKSFATHGQFLVRGVSERGYGLVYPLLIVPAWRLFASIPDAYAAAKAINGVLMSLAAIPAYQLARRLLPARLSLLVAGLTVLVPSMLYTGMLMTENAFYPLFLAVALMLVTTLERPTRRRQLALLVLCGVAFETRAQAVALIPAVATAPLLLALFERRGWWRSLRPFVTLYVTLAGAALAALLVTVARGESPLSLLGAYRVATSSTYTAGGILRFLLYHVAELDLYLGIVPFAALLAIWLAPRGATPAVRAFAASSLALAVWLLAEVSAFASQASVNKIMERNLFYLAPLALIALLGLASDGIVPRGRRPVLIAAGLAGVLPFFIPFTRFITTSALSDTFALLPWWWAQDHLISLADVRFAALGVSAAAAATFVLLPRRYALVLPALVGAYFIATSFVVENGRHGIHKATIGSLWAGTHRRHADWISRVTGPGASVAVLWTGRTTAYPVWENEFFNRSLGTVYDLDGAPRPDPLPETPASRQPSGVLVDAGAAIRAQYVLTDGSVDLAGRVVARDPLGVELYRVDGPIVVLAHVTGLYPNDTWSGRSVTYERVQCEAGRLSVLLISDPSLFTAEQVVVARERGIVVGRARIAPSGHKRLTVPLRPAEPGQRCVVRFDIARTAVPARVSRSSRDRRELGAHFLSFDYRP
jgi:hypothetical protein